MVILNLIIARIFLRQIILTDFFLYFMDSQRSYLYLQTYSCSHICNDTIHYLSPNQTSRRFIQRTTSTPKLDIKSPAK